MAFRERKHQNAAAGLLASRAAGLAVVFLACVIISGPCAVYPATGARKGFASAEQAVKAFVSAIRARDETQLLAILGEEGGELISSGDPVDDRRRSDLFVRYYDQGFRLEKQGSRRILVIGDKAWPFPVPLVKKEGQWLFDTAAGKEEIINRRIGENELSTVQTLLAIADAQREYALLDRDDDGIREYARKFRSDSMARNGLYWETNPGEALSPLGNLVADARAEGYDQMRAHGGPVPYNGYFFKMLTAQGANAQGGAFEYMVGGKMLGGFAVVAFPAAYGSTGVMTFLVNHLGVVYEKNLGQKTAEEVIRMQLFDPDKTWRKVE